jgi:hypothetical protein
VSENRLAPIAFISGLVGLLVANVVLGPLAIALGVTALRRDPARRARAVLALVLGVADLAVFLYLGLRAGGAHGSLQWKFLGH